MSWDLQTEAAEQSHQRYEDTANGLIGGHVGPYKVIDREKPGKRVLYVLVDGRTGEEIRLPGYRVVRLAREAIASGLPVIRLRQPWRSEAGK